MSLVEGLVLPITIHEKKGERGRNKKREEERAGRGRKRRGSEEEGRREGKEGSEILL